MRSQGILLGCGILLVVAHRAASCANRVPGFTYHPVDGQTIADREKAYKELMEAMEAELEEAEVATAAEVNNTTKPEETCRQCSAEEEAEGGRKSPRFFFGMFTNEDETRRCCNEETKLEISAVEAEDENTTDESNTEATVVEDDLKCRQCDDQSSRTFLNWFSTTQDDSSLPCCEQPSCRVCGDVADEASNSRTFGMFSIEAQEDMKDLPCCQAPRRRLANTTDCGRKAENNRLLGGVVATEHEFPWHCALLKKDGSYHGCSAVLLSCEPEIIIATAAHCFVREARPEHIQVACGAAQVASEEDSPMEPDEVRLQVTEVIRHEDFQWLTYHSPILGNNNGHPSGLSLFENDIAVLKVNGTLPCQKRVIWPACLPTPDTEFAGWSRTGLAGWGKNATDGPLSKELMKIDTPIVVDDYCERKVCETHIGPIGIRNCIITDNKICAGGVPDEGPCQGDSGGALMVNDDDLQGWSVAGLVSYQPGNVLEWPRCGSDKFTIFTEVSKFLGWIADQFGLDPPSTDPSDDDEETAVLSKRQKKREERRKQRQKRRKSS